MRGTTANLLDPPPKGYRPCVGIFLLDAGRRRVFVGRRLDTPDAWQLPQGGIDPGEGPLEAGLREMREEIGTDRASLLHEHPAWLTYDLPPDLRRRMWGGRYRGQAQRWLAFAFEGVDADIRLDAGHPEFSTWRWADPERIAEEIVPFKRDVYLSVVDGFRHLWA